MHAGYTYSPVMMYLSGVFYVYASYKCKGHHYSFDNSFFPNFYKGSLSNLHCLHGGTTQLRV